MAPTDHNFRYLLKPGTDFGFVAKFRTWLIISALLTSISIGSLFVNKAVRGSYLNWTIDFRGGTEVIYAFRSKADPKKLSSWVQSELLRVVKDTPLAECPIKPDMLAELVALIDAGTISGKIAKDIFARMLASGERPQVIVDREGLTQVSDTAAIEAAARAVVHAKPKEAAAYKAGKQQMLGFFVGQTIKAMGGKANPQLVNDILKKLLES